LVMTDGGESVIYTPKPERYRSLGRTEAVETTSEDGLLDLREVLLDLRERGVRSVIVEGGSRVLTTMIRERLWQKMQLFLAPVVVGGTDAPAIFGGGGVRELSEAHRLRFDAIERIGPDLLVTAYPE
ncbi:MAG: dihydrofolate reductase family protein, partial [Thermoanaerobaculia bacterium]|nr:dihydrofolate reductase family protein [Thermoanaerobaculia bacterium]